ncbi:hypothetical protein Athai_50740 [Actinocatenispora thailandica]|uniref:Uncharacterized protein n=1 Tax=Actinocatenispora thailandica TaxID=227318 RepID=A0A7R7DTP7_9ACTN|nr:hypothetical protein [Actinocatenispora thailandica]BCJ37571.1 hypothetical protein Athai_50740 [Actinocatenispora thailandica]
MDVSSLSRDVMAEVKQRGLFLLSPEPEYPGDPDFVCVVQDPSGFPQVGHVGASMGGGPPYVAFAPDPRNPMRTDEIAVGLTTWEAGIRAVLAAFDRS